jgi:hypothetical protein
MKMGTKTGVPVIRDLLKKIDWQLLLFLLLVLNVKLAVKVLAVLIIYLWRRDLAFGFRIKNSRLPLFYVLVILIALVNLFLSRGFLQVAYDAAVVTGIGFWILSILIIHQIKLFVDRDDSEKIHQTLKVFFLINILVSVINLGAIIWETGALNPYLYQGEYQKYFISTGDYIKGVSFDTSTTNAIINAFGIIYFLVKKDLLMVLSCMCILILTASNFTSLLLIIVFAGMFLLRSDALQKSMMLVCVSLQIIFLAKISPQNNQYVASTFARFLPAQKGLVALISAPVVNAGDDEGSMVPAMSHIDSIHERIIDQELKMPGMDQKPEVIYALRSRTRPAIPGPNINKPPYQQQHDTTALQMGFLHFIDSNKKVLSLSTSREDNLSTAGKLLAWQQTIHFFQQHPQKIFLGDGIGNFSSRLAYRTSGLKIEGSYPAKFTHIHPDFLQNHLEIFLFFFSRRKGLHSVINTTDSTYDQLLGEYGVAGILAFAVYYIGFFFRRINNNGYTLPLVILLLGFLSMGYWFEQLSIIILFELLVLFYHKENGKINNTPDEQG